MVSAVPVTGSVPPVDDTAVPVSTTVSSGSSSASSTSVRVNCLNQNRSPAWIVKVKSSTGWKSAGPEPGAEATETVTSTSRCG